MGDRVYKYSRGPVGVNLISNEIPGSYNLLQNYPNPFNPVTKIIFPIPTLQYALIKVYDVLGKEVVTLVNTKLEAGSYETEFNGNDLPGGIYFCRIIIQSDKVQNF